MAKKTKLAKVAEYLNNKPGATATEIAEKLNVTPQYVYVMRSVLKKRGMLGGAPVKKATEEVVEKPAVDIDAMYKNDPVNHPTHYKTGGVETIDFIEAKGLGYHLGNVVKYISRAGRKGTNSGLEDLKKAQWYLARAIEKNEYTNPNR